MYLLGIHNGVHDASACLFRDYKLLAAVSQERLTRRKNDGVVVAEELPQRAIDECLAIAGILRRDVDVVCSTRSQFEMQSFRLQGRMWARQLYARLTDNRRLYQMTYMMRKQSTKKALEVFDAPSFRERHGFRRAALYFCNHHAAHGVPAYFFSEFDDALIYTADGFGDDVAYSARTGRQGDIALVFGGDENLNLPMKVNSVGLLYNFFTEALGFIPNRHEGKLTGLSAFGLPKAGEELIAHFSVDDRGEATSDYPNYSAMRDHAFDICKRLSREDAAASVQVVTEHVICRAVEALIRNSSLTSLALGGGVFSNVRLNRAVLETTSAKNVFIFPAMGDEGLPVGACLLYLRERDGARTWLANRYLLSELYLGANHDVRFPAAASQHPEIVADREAPVEKAVDALTGGKAVAIYTDRMEFGPRALGARSILASPVQREVNDSINKRLNRSEFMPFAPVVLADHVATVFDIHAGNAHAARFMTITCDVRPEWRDRIPAVVHVDGSARPQIIEATENPLYFQVLELFYKRTGLPVLVNTSFNVHEEPIIDTPEQALTALIDDRIDCILTKDALYRVPIRRL
ncbi:MAG TPA: carbamoyltransferase C-terminal domain-containing protein [Xanthobacteraceae bacterium]|nr:carbamoyltransferase C-terminal domain-containing protein [Xanthobacteraceae bacterium]